jgi:hypothetical protein
MPSVPPAQPAPAAKAEAGENARLSENFGRLPLSFEPNEGQTDGAVDFLARADGYTVFLTPTSAVFSMTRPASAAAPAGRDIGVAVHMQIVGANPVAHATPVAPLPGKINYFTGNDTSQWHTNISSYGGVEYQDVYPGIDLVYYGNNRQLEYDFVVAPGADPGAIGLNFAGADDLEINAQGDLVLHTPLGELVQQEPYVYQEIAGVRQQVAGNYVLSPQSELVGFEIGDYDASQPLVVDPLVLGYSTFLGGSMGNDHGWDILVDAGGNAYVTGGTSSAIFPVVPGAFDLTFNGELDVFVAKMNAAGNALLFSTYLGGSSSEQGFGGIALDGGGHIYLTGHTASADFPTTFGAFDTTYNGGNADAFVVKMSPDASSLAYATYVGGTDYETDNASIALDPTGHAYVTGQTNSADFPVTAGAFDVTLGGPTDAFVVKLSPNGTTLDYGTFVGGANLDTSEDVAVDADGNAYITGQTASPDFPTTPASFDPTYNGGPFDAYIAKLPTEGHTLAYSAFLGGSLADIGRSITLDSARNAYVAGETRSHDFPVTPGAYDLIYNEGFRDIFVAKVSRTGAALIYGTFVGGTREEYPWSIAVDGENNAYVAGNAISDNFPTTASAFDNTLAGTADAIFFKLDPLGASLVHSTYLGGTEGENAFGIALDSEDNVYLTGRTSSGNFPTTPGAYKRRSRGSIEAFITKFVSA